ncbi:hypothetical protein [Paenibacillus lutrae]|uniref:Uncharacterized protein n=1 Tax=Paenibacillus lutrae TaxID=2078573 RepID=A0A7X3FFP7_9BACL|nr:hypothetical protein [Paenibacillus lutrae]MVO98826.1 hypothetical protein [Paenibacillus lutrae]
MATIHIQKRTIVSRAEYNTEAPNPANSEVKTYLLSPEELAYYRNLPMSEADKAFKPSLKVVAMEKREEHADSGPAPDSAS